MSNSGPPRKWESIVGQLIPPACREHVLGDLAERYRNDRQYLGEGLRLIPMLLGSGIRRAADPQTLLIELCATYFSFVAVGWQSGGTSFLIEHSGFLRLAFSAITTIGVVVLCDVYWPRLHIERLPDGVIRAAMAAGPIVLCQFVLAGVQDVPGVLVVFILGGIASALLLSFLRLVIEPGAFRRFQQSLSCGEVDPIRMSPDEFRVAARRMYWRLRAARNVLVLLWIPPAVWAVELWHAHSIVFRLGCAISSAGLLHGVFKMRRALACGARLEADFSLENSLEFCRRHLEARRYLQRHVWSHLLGPLLLGTLVVMVSGAGSRSFWLGFPRLVGLTIFYSALGWFAQRRLPNFERQREALTRGRSQR